MDGAGDLEGAEKRRGPYHKVLAGYALQVADRWVLGFGDTANGWHAGGWQWFVATYHRSLPTTNIETFLLVSCVTLKEASHELVQSVLLILVVLIWYRCR